VKREPIRASQEAGSEGMRGGRAMLPDDLGVGASPWVDFTFTNFWLDERVRSYLNFGAQLGAYVGGRVRLSVRLVAPVEQVEDARTDADYYRGGVGTSDTYIDVPSRAMSVLYGATVGIVVANSRSFVFAPGVSLVRTDVSDYGSAFALSMPFEWTTRRHMRWGFELAVGHAFGGSVDRVCQRATTTLTYCGKDEDQRPGGTTILLQFQMGWALSNL